MTIAQFKAKSSLHSKVGASSGRLYELGKSFREFVFVRVTHVTSIDYLMLYLRSSTGTYICIRARHNWVAKRAMIRRLINVDFKTRPC